METRGRQDKRVKKFNQKKKTMAQLGGRAKKEAAL